MANRVEIIQFKSQKDINKERQQKLDQKKADIRRQVEEIKNSQNQRVKRVKV
jgi:hypothetical protein